MFLRYTDYIKGLIITSTGVLVLTPDALIIRLIEAPRPTLIFWRGLLLSISLTIFFLIRYRTNALGVLRQIGIPGLLCSLCFCGSTIMFVTSITLTAAANTLVILSIAPLFAAVLSHFFLAETAPLRTWMTILVCFMGILSIFAGNLGSGALLGDLCAVGAAIFLASYFVIVRHARAVNMVPALIISGLMVAILVSPFAHPLSISMRDFTLLLILGCVILPLSFALMTIGPRYLPAPEVGLILLLETVLGPVWVWFGLGEIPDSTTVIGGIAVVSALTIHLLLGYRASSLKHDSVI
ncbi:DMT family transporter [Desulfococcaceae bacterium HSG7]|nr:DMT family transporter [Desulfococcaceae bacterium HSG7]